MRQDNNFLHHFYSHIPCGMWHIVRIICRCFWDISTHTSRVGCDEQKSVRMDGDSKFLLTHPVWDVTTNTQLSDWRSEFLLTHPVWDVTKWNKCSQHLENISTHTSRVGCDHDGCLPPAVVDISTHTSRVGCDNQIPDTCHNIGISTHTSRVGCDRYI